MDSSEWRTEAARNALGRLLPRLEAKYKNALADNPVRRNHFNSRLNREWERCSYTCTSFTGGSMISFYTLEQVSTC